MKNIWYIFGTVVIASVVFCLLSDIPYMKDIAKKETTEVIAVYVEYQTGNVHPGARRLFFENEDCEFNLLAPVITKEHVKMEAGRTYKVEYFDNSKVIKNYELIE